MMKNRRKVEDARCGVSDKLILKIGDKFKMDYFGSGVGELLKLIKKQNCEKYKKNWIVTVNTEFVMEAMKNSSFMKTVNGAEIRVIDGIGLVWAKEVLKSKRGIRRWVNGFKVGFEILQGGFREELIQGADLIEELCEMASKEGLKVYFLGGWGTSAEKSGKNLAKKYKKLQYKACIGRPEYGDKEVVGDINKFGTDILLVAYGMKKQEEWIRDNLKDLKVKTVMGVGRSFDYYSKELKRAPQWLRRMGLEWLYSLIKEPKRWKRQLALPRFVWMVLTKVA